MKKGLLICILVVLLFNKIKASAISQDIIKKYELKLYNTQLEEIFNTKNRYENNNPNKVELKSQEEKLKDIVRNIELFNIGKIVLTGEAYLNDLDNIKQDMLRMVRAPRGFDIEVGINNEGDIYYEFSYKFKIYIDLEEIVKGELKQ
ncbi:MAG: hypothetical protein ACQERZ_01485 [Fusobacteriota bacterium]